MANSHESTVASPTPVAAPLPLSLNIRLSAMMFLQYAIWGAWLPSLLPFLLFREFSADQIGNIFVIGAVGALLAPFLAGQIADRFFPTQFFFRRRNE